MNTKCPSDAYCTYFHKRQPSAEFYTIENLEQKLNVIGCFLMLARQLLPGQSLVRKL